MLIPTQEQELQHTTPIVLLHWGGQKFRLNFSHCVILPHSAGCIFQYETVSPSALESWFPAYFNGTMFDTAEEVYASGSVILQVFSRDKVKAHSGT